MYIEKTINTQAIDGAIIWFNNIIFFKNNIASMPAGHNITTDQTTAEIINTRKENNISTAEIMKKAGTASVSHIPFTTLMNFSSFFYFYPNFSKLNK